MGRSTVTVAKNATRCVLVVAIALMSVVLGSAPWAMAQPTGTSAVDRFGACLAAQKSGQVLLLIDESGSLKQSDPQGSRVTAAKYLMEQLAQFSADSHSRIDVAVAGFSDTFDQQLAWTALDHDSLPAIDGAIDGFRTRDTGQDTDYWAALQGAQTTLAAHAGASSDRQTCSTLVWFTDGKLDYSIRGNASKPYAPGHTLVSQTEVDATAAAAKESICRPGGLADQLRASDVVTFAIGLAPTGGDADAFDLLKAIATGDPATSAGPCGDIRTPTPGDFYPVQNIDDLLFAFDTVSTPGQPPLTFEAGACPFTVCDEAQHRFVLDTSVRAVNVLAAASKAGLIPVLIAPDGQQLELKDGGSTPAELGGVSVDYRWLTKNSLSFRLSNAGAPQWTGPWALVFVDPDGDSGARTRSSIHIAGDLFPAWPDHARVTLHSGDPEIPVAFGIVDSQGKPVNTDTILGEATFSAVLLDANGKSLYRMDEMGKADIASPHVLDLRDVAPGGATLRMTLAVTTAAATDQHGNPVPGTVLAPQSVDLPVTIDPPVGYPKIGSKIDFGSIEGEGSFAGGLTVTGPGCVWTPEQSSSKLRAAPDGVDAVSVNSTANTDKSCVRIAEGSSATLPLTLAVPHEGNGVLNGTIQVMVAPADGSAPPIAVEVPFSAAMHKTLNTTTLWIVLVVALLMGPGIPVALLYFFKWLTARIPATALRAEQMAVSVVDGKVLRDNRPFAVRDDDLLRLTPGLGSPARRIDIGGIELRTRVGRSPFGRGFVVATQPGRVGAAGKSGVTHGKAPNPKLPLAVHKTWFVLHDPTGPPSAATIVMLVGGSTGGNVVATMTTEITENLPRILTSVRARATSEAPPTGPASDTGGVAATDNPFGRSASTPTGAGYGSGASTNPFRASDTPPTQSGSSNPFGDSGSRPDQQRANPFGAGPFGGPSGQAPRADPFSTSNPPSPDSPSDDPFGDSGASGSGSDDPFRPR